MSDTPTTDQVKAIFTTEEPHGFSTVSERRNQFDRWLAAERANAAAVNARKVISQYLATARVRVYENGVERQFIIRGQFTDTDGALVLEAYSDQEDLVPSGDFIEWLTKRLHQRWTFEYDQCDHGTYMSSGPNNGEPYAMCDRWAKALAPDILKFLQTGESHA